VKMNIEKRQNLAVRLVHNGRWVEDNVWKEEVKNPLELVVPNGECVGENDYWKNAIPRLKARSQMGMGVGQWKYEKQIYGGAQGELWKLY